jgi:hypothetical protein
MHTEDRENMVENCKETEPHQDTSYLSYRMKINKNQVTTHTVQLDTNLVVLVFRKLVDVLHVKRDG